MSESDPQERLEEAVERLEQAVDRIEADPFGADESIELSPPVTSQPGVDAADDLGIVKVDSDPHDDGWDGNVP